jgi:tetratricopeptide (TPR) repeat protein
MGEPFPRRVEELFDQAVDLDPERQAAFLDEQCQGDADLRAAVEELLQLDRRAEAAETLLRSPLAESRRKGSAPPAPRLPALARYRLVRVLGEGGMGTVYEAEQDNPRRTVALKVIRPGLVAPPLLKRFAQEAQILGLLHHPGIASIYEASVAEDGQPFFAMEFIRGLPLDEYARRHGLDAAARLELVARVCDAVQHAHEHGVVHRDLKPTNVLVDETGQPRVLDFGVARGLDEQLRATTAHTQPGQLVGTPCYMSPEQVAADPDLDRRSDVYTLGVILFELLAGRLPYPLEQLPLAGVVQVIREREPARLGALDRGLRGDVETIVGKALEKEPARRYPSAAELAADIRRHLAHEPIQARPPSALYQLGKFARRHQALVATTAAFLGLLLVAGAVTTWQAVRLAHAERDEALRQGRRTVEQARRSQEVQDALARATELREQARSPAGGPGQWAEARAVARRAEALAEDGQVGPELAERVAALLRKLEEEEKDRRMVAELDGIRLRQAEVKGQQFDTRAAGPRYAEAFRRYGVDVEALPEAEAARRVRGSAIREALLAALDHWAWSTGGKGAGPVKLSAVADGADDNPWRRSLREAARRKDTARLKELAGDARALEQPPTVLALLGNILSEVGRGEEAVAFLRQAQQRHPDDFWINHDLAYILLQGVSPPRAEEALGYFRAALALRPGSPGAHFNLGNALLARRDLPAAAACYGRALELYSEHVSAHYNLGSVLWMQGDPAGAAACFRRTLELDPKHAEAHCYLGNTLLEQGHLRAALEEVQIGHELGSQQKNWPAPSAQWLVRCKRFIQLDGRLPAVLEGEAPPSSIAECIDWAELCRYKRLPAHSVRFYTRAFDADAKLANDLQANRRYQAACSAALAGCGEGEDAATVPDKARASLLEQALEWLRADLAGWTRRLEGGRPQDRVKVRTELHTWRSDPALAGVRDAGPLAALPSAQRARWQQLWAEVAALAAKARDGK